MSHHFLIHCTSPCTHHALLTGPSCGMSNSGVTCDVYESSGLVHQPPPPTHRALLTSPSCGMSRRGVTLSFSASKVPGRLMVKASGSSLSASSRVGMATSADSNAERVGGSGGGDKAAATVKLVEQDCLRGHRCLPAHVWGWQHLGTQGSKGVGVGRRVAEEEGLQHTKGVAGRRGVAGGTGQQG